MKLINLKERFLEDVKFIRTIRNRFLNTIFEILGYHISKTRRARVILRSDSDSACKFLRETISRLLMQKSCTTVLLNEKKPYLARNTEIPVTFEDNTYII